MRVLGPCPVQASFIVRMRLFLWPFVPFSSQPTWSWIYPIPVSTCSFIFLRRRIFEELLSEIGGMFSFACQLFLAFRRSEGYWIIRFKSPDYSSQKSKRFTKQNKKVLNSLNRKIFQCASKLLQSHWPRRYFLSLHISKQKIICKSILSWPVGFEKKKIFVPNDLYML